MKAAARRRCCRGSRDLSSSNRADRGRGEEEDGSSRLVTTPQVPSKIEERDQGRGRIVPLTPLIPVMCTHPRVIFISTSSHQKTRVESCAMQNTPPSEHPDTDLSQTQLGTSPQWPGERHPTRWDVHDANESLATTFLERYKTVLLQSEQAQNCRWLIPPPEEDILQSSGPQAENGVDNVLVSTVKI